MSAVYASVMTDATDARLAAQYEMFPYPQRDPRDERRRLVVGSPGHLREIDHWVFGARRSASRPLRALIAGAGTGDATVMLAQQLAWAGRAGRVTWLDRSGAAMRIAQARATERGLGNVVWERRSLLDLPGLGLGPFDYVDCCGVLHHLPDPAAGLRALVSVLAPGGGLGLMVYAPHGRTGVYMVQDALSALTPPDEPAAARLDVARRVLRHLPETAWLRANRGIPDHLTGGDAGVQDLLLNARDRAFTVRQFADMLASAGLAIQCWMEPRRYDPAALLADARLRARIATLDPTARAALAEALAGNMSAHIVYCRRSTEPIERADPTAADAVPVMREGTGEELARAIGPDGRLVMVMDGLRMPLALPAAAPALIRLIDGQRNVREIVAALFAKGANPEAVPAAWADTFRALESVNRVLLAPPA
jgi:SAM-dependent methyltransferase